MVWKTFHKIVLGIFCGSTFCLLYFSPGLSSFELAVRGIYTDI